MKIVEEAEQRKAAHNEAGSQENLRTPWELIGNIEKALGFYRLLGGGVVQASVL